MSLTLAHEIARGGLLANATQSSLVSRNIANVDNPNAGRKYAHTISSEIGVHIGVISNAVSPRLLESVLGTTARNGELSSMTSALERLAGSIADPDLGISPAAMLTDMQQALYAAAADPSNATLLRNIVSVATDVANTLKDAANLVVQVRKEANVDLAEATNQLGTLLKDFEDANNQIVSGTIVGRDVTDQIDRRNALLREISGLIDINTTTRANNDMVLFTASGTTLFEKAPRTVSFDFAPLSPGQPGGLLTIDGVTYSGAAATKLGGKIGGLLQIRDDVSISYGRQIDELARGLINTFAESDQSATPTLPDVAGLFTWSGGPALPPAGTVLDGLALTIQVNPNADPNQGGSIDRLRDGGIGDPSEPDYVYNPDGVTGFSQRLRDLAAGLTEAQSFDPAAGLSASTSLVSLASDSAAWLESRRSSTSERLADNEVLGERAVNAWQGQIGINLDEEMTSLMAIERSYQATARLMSTVDQMFQAILRATGAL
jgi:flagellar hook-associated protein 1 FlgK